MPRITVLVENTAGKNRLWAEHGLSYLIETGGRKFLFDTGQGMVLRNNLERLNIDLSTVEALILSHGHYDHTGGIEMAAESIHPFRVYAHPQAAEAKFARNADGSARSIGMSEQNRRLLREKAEWVPVEKPVELGGGLKLTGPIPRRTDFEDTGGAFVLDEACTQPDELPDDQAAFIETEAGTVVVLGCAHAGVINTLNYIRELTENRPIHTVIGGMHLVNAGEKRIGQTVSALEKLNVQKLYPCHCTGFTATARLANAFPGRCSPCPTGTVINF